MRVSARPHAVESAAAEAAAQLPGLVKDSGLGTKEKRVEGEDSGDRSWQGPKAVRERWTCTKSEEAAQGQHTQRLASAM